MDPNQNVIKQAENSKYLEVWIKGQRYVASWKEVNMALIDPQAKAPLRQVQFLIPTDREVAV